VRVITRSQLAGLDTHIVGPNDATLTVVLMHGFGAPGDDLVALADPRFGFGMPGVRFVFPEAPIELGGLYGDARAWWRLDLQRLEMGLRTGQVRDFLSEIPDGIEPARTKMIDLLDIVQKTYAVSDDRLVLGGFSQGAMLTMDVAVHRPGTLAGLVLMSGTLIAEKIWQPKLGTLSGVPVFQSHGRQDPLLPFSIAEVLRDRLIAAGAVHEWHPFDGGHAIPPPVLSAGAAFLKARRG
jgi:phospholipase/carboxylesterase